MLFSKAKSRFTHVPQVLFALALMGVLAPASAEDLDEPTTMDTVVVTVQKRPQAAREVPLAITAFDARELERTRAQTMEDLAPLVPSTTLTQASGVNSLTVRGVGGGGRNIGFDPRVGVYLDGVYVGAAAALTQPLFDIDQVVFLRGPQGHLFGRNSVAGAVALTTVVPSEEFVGSVRGTWGTFGQVDGSASVSGPLGSDAVLGKLAVANEHRDGYTRNRFNGQDLDGLDRFTTRGQLRLLPNDQWTVDVYGDYSHSRQNAPFGQPTTGFFDTPISGGPPPKHEVDFNRTPFVDLTLGGVSGTVSYHADNGTTFTSISAWRTTDQYRQNDTDYSADDLIYVNYNDRFKQISQELRMTSSEDRKVRFVAGLYGAREVANTERFVNIGQDTSTLVPVPGVPIRLPFGLAFRLQPGFGAASIAEVTTDTLAAFGSLDADLTQRLTLNLGGRYTVESKDLLFDLDGSGSGALLIASLSGARDSAQVNDFSPRAGFTFRASDQVNLYTTYSTGFKSGGWNVDFLNVGQVAAGYDFEPETVRSLELGAKGASADGRFSFEAAIFEARYRDFQVSQFVNLGGGTAVLQMRNAASVRTRGFEAGVQWKASERFTLGGQLGLLDARFDSFPNGAPGGVALDGKRLPDAPKTTAALLADYRTEFTAGFIDWHVDASYRSSSYSAATNDAVSERIGGRALANVRVAYSSFSAPWTVAVWVRNVTDKDYTTTRGRDFFGNQVSQYGAPRQIGVDFSWYF